MTSALVEDAGLKACAILLLDLVEGARSLVIFDAFGHTVWRHDSPEPMEAVTWLPPQDEAWHALDSAVRLRSQHNEYNVFARDVHTDDESASYTLCLYQEIASSPTRIADRQAAHRAVVCLSQLLGTHYALNHELNSMTDELARRYEELNLVYNTDEKIRSQDEKQHVLNEIIANCIDYLNVDVAALCLSEEEPIVSSQSRVADDLVMSVERSRSALSRLMHENTTSVVLNTPQEREDAGCGLECPYKLVVSPIRDSMGRLYGTLLIMNGNNRRDFDNGDRNLLNATAEKLSKIVSADYDGLTGLATREGFEMAVRDVLQDALKRGRDVCVLHANVDQLQLVNDTFGHEAGDELIRQVASTIPQMLRGNDRIARISGDEFGILLLDCSLNNAIRMADRVCERVSRLPCKVGERQLDVGISIGVAKITDDIDDVISVMATADLACSVAKEQGRGRAFAYRDDDDQMKARKHQMHWVGRIQGALKNNRFVLYSQVIESTDRINGRPHFEILLRMLDDQGKILSPYVFMPVAERYHLMPSVDRWVIQHSLATLEQLNLSGASADSVFTINLSGQSLMDPKTLDFLVSQLRNTSVSTRNLCFEITENAAITDLHNARAFIAKVKNFGCRFALDDFGAGVSSFANLRALDVDYLKIDGSFVVDMASDPVSASMVAAINQVGQTMKLKTVAEYVESVEIRQILTDLGVDYLQGYDIGKPRPLLDQLHELSRTDVRSA